MLASIPQTARVNKKTMQPPTVAYDGGTPKFEPIEKTTVSRAVNTDKDIIKVGDLYYMCFQGVWFMAKAPDGPWEVTSKVPKEIYEIPVSSPSYNVTYVTVEDDDDEWVTFAAAAAYTGVMIAWGCAVWGTGYYYPPYYYGGNLCPYYPTYGYGAYYNPWTGAYGRGVCRVRTVRRRWLRRAVQPGDRSLLTRRGGLRPGGARGVRGSLQPAHGRLRTDAAGIERVRQLGINVRPARRSVGEHVARHEQPHWQHDARDARQRRRDIREPQHAGTGRRRHCCQDRRRRRVCRTRRQRLPQRRWQLAEVPTTAAGTT